MLSQITLIKCSGEEGPQKHPDLMTTPKSTFPPPLPTCVSLPAVASASGISTATKGPGHGDTRAVELPDQCSSSSGLP